MLTSFMIAVIAFVFVYLGEPGMIFGWYQKLINKIPYDWIYKPLGGCDKCLGGQAAFWYYIFVHDEYSLFYHAFFVSMTILFIIILEKLVYYGVKDD